MEHISERVSPSGSISSAPKEFSVHVRIPLNLHSERVGERAVGQEGGAGSELCSGPFVSPGPSPAFPRLHFAVYAASGSDQVMAST